MEPVILSELGTRSETRPLTDDQVTVLRASGLVEVNRQAGAWRISPTTRVGAVRAGDLDVQVHPKVGVVKLLFLLGYARDPRFRPDEEVGAGPIPDLWPALAESLIRHVERALAGGLLQGYASVDQALPLIRGRVRFGDQFARRPGMPLPIELSYDDYTTDIAENRLLRSAVRRMLAVPRLPTAMAERLAGLDARLAGIHLLPPGAPLPRWRPTRRSARYLPALRLADLVLTNQSAEPGPGDVTVAAFVVNMNTVFENFVSTALREALGGYPGDTEEQYEAHLDVGRTILIKPDVVHLIDGSAAAVFDAKYKLERPTSGYANADTYQMLAYCTALDVRSGWLIYAKGTSAPVRRRIRNSTVDVIHHPLDMTLEPAAILRDVSDVVRQALTGHIVTDSR